MRRRPDEIVGRGVFSGSKGGYGFVTLESGYDKDIFIPEGHIHGAIDGDLVELVYHIFRAGDGMEKTEGRITRIAEYGRETVIGTLVTERTAARRSTAPMAYVIPDDPRISFRPVVRDTVGAGSGDKVMVRLRRGGSSGAYIEGEIVAEFGDTQSMSANYMAILAECGIPDGFTDEELAFAEDASHREITAEGRLDLRSKVIFTIDGENAKDLDDAVSLAKTKNGYKLGVHIADVASYVEEKTVLDRLVMSRGTSVYFTDRVVPMLPPSLSNGACSLNAGTDKYTLSAMIDLDRDGNITRTEIHPAVIRSRVRGIYSEVNGIFEGTADRETRGKYRDVLPTLSKMHELYGILRARAQARGYIDMDIDEAHIVLDADGMPTDVVRTERGDAERMIEQLMLTANEAVAALLCDRGIPCVYRIHESPAPDRLESFLSYISHIGMNAPALTSETVTSLDFSAILDSARDKGLESAVSNTMLRSMMKAKYSELRMPHFGLGLECYCHFTSPIRRLSDLATHRIIHRVLIDGKQPSAYKSYARRAARAATDTELRAVSAERRITDLYKVIYMSDKIGQTFDAAVSSVTAFGIFAELSNTCEGLIPISELPGLFTFYENDLSMRCAELVYRLGDLIRVRLEEADMIRGKLRFSLVL